MILLANSGTFNNCTWSSGNPYNTTYQIPYINIEKLLKVLKTIQHPSHFHSGSTEMHPEVLLIRILLPILLTLFEINLNLQYRLERVQLKIMLLFQK